MNDENINIRDILEALKKKWQLIVSITLAATIIATVVSFFVIKPKYEASTRLFIGKTTGEEDKYSSSDIVMYQNMLKSYAEAIKTNDLVSRAFKDSELDVDAKSALSGLTVTPMAATQILSITYTGEDKQEAKDVIQAISDEFVIYSKELYSNANVEIIEKVTLPESPISPNKKLNIAMAFVVGLIIGSGIAVMIAMLDSTFKDKEKLEEILGVPVLGVIPNTEKM